MLVDTCALGYKDTINLIEQAEHITFIKSIIEEMDRKKKTDEDSKKQEKILATNIRLYINKILLDTEKFMLSSFSGLKDTKYPDDILLQYMLILPKQIRPTLITTDKNLAVKAKLHELPFILFDVAKGKYEEGEEAQEKKEKEKQEEISKEVTKKLGNGIYQINIDDDILYKGVFIMEVIYPKACGVDMHKSFIVAVICDSISVKPQYLHKRFSTFNNSLIEFRNWLLANDCQNVCMESTGKYYVPVYN